MQARTWLGCNLGRPAALTTAAGGHVCAACCHHDQTAAVRRTWGADMAFPRGQSTGWRLRRLWGRVLMRTLSIRSGACAVLCPQHGE
jgi:hypothetical protein